MTECLARHTIVCPELMGTPWVTVYSYTVVPTSSVVLSWGVCKNVVAAALACE